jgi:hypothetical protein
MINLICDSLCKITRAGHGLFRSIIIGISRAISSTIFVVIFILYFTQPNIYRALTPQLFGIQRVSPDVFTDQPSRALSIKSAVEKATKNAANFFSNQTATPKYIVCFTSKCTDVFGNLPLGLTLGYHRVIISPDGFDQRIFNHERIHVDLHALTGFSDVFSSRYPMWFNEGLAEFLSGSNCQGVLAKPEEIRRVKRAQSRQQWNAMVSDRQFRRHYGNACRAVEKISQFIGKKQLSALVHNAQNRRQFLNSLPNTP